MKSFAELHQAVHGVIAGKRIGTPVFVRYLLQGLDPPDAVLPRLAQAAAAVRDWLGQPLDRVYALGPDGGQAALSLEFHGGATGLVVYARGQPRGSGVDVMVLGNHGAVYADAGTAQLWDEAPPPGGRPDPAILVAAERSVRSGKPEPLGGEGRP